MLPTLVLALSLPALASPDGLTVVLSGADVRTVELGCRDGTRVRRPPRAPRPGADPQVRFPGIPSGECTLYFKGVTPSRYGPVPQHGTLQCNLDGRVARCAAPTPPTAPAPPAARSIPSSDPTPPGRTTRAAPQPTPPAGPPVAAPPTRPSGALEITVLDAPGVTGFELTCRSGQRDRAPRPRDGTPARFAEVRGEGCRLNFRGTPPAIVHRVTPGTALHCEIKGVTALCESRPLGD